MENLLPDSGFVEQSNTVSGIPNIGVGLIVTTIVLVQIDRRDLNYSPYLA